MAAAAPKENTVPLSPVSSAESTRHGARQFNRVLASSIIQWFSMMLAIPAESELWMRVYGSDFAGQARLLGTLSSVGAVIGFVVNPILGAMAESRGRKFTMMVSQLAAVFKSALLTASPSAPAMIVSNLLMPLTIGSWEMGSHCTVADLFRTAPVQLAAAKGKLQMVPSVCAVVCPIVGAWLAARDLRWAFAAQTGLWGLNALLTIRLPETVPPEERKPFAWTAANPFSVLQLFVRGNRLRLLAVSQILNELTEMRSLYQVYDLSRTQVLGMDMAQRSRFTSFASLFSIPGYLLAEPLLRTCGELGASVLGLLTFAAQNCVWGASSLAWQFYAAQPLGLLRGVASVALNTRLTLDGAAAGLTQGELQGALNNLQTLCQAAAPMIWGRLYASGVARVRKDKTLLASPRPLRCSPQLQHLPSVRPLACFPLADHYCPLLCSALLCRVVSCRVVCGRHRRRRTHSCRRHLSLGCFIS
jgi:DHA1 family tetracycline resistance protein-like MFS transporter